MGKRHSPIRKIFSRHSPATRRRMPPCLRHLDKLLCPHSTPGRNCKSPREKSSFVRPLADHGESPGENNRVAARFALHLLHRTDVQKHVPGSPDCRAPCKTRTGTQITGLQSAGPEEGTHSGCAPHWPPSPVGRQPWCVGAPALPQRSPPFSLLDWQAAGLQRGHL